MRDRRHPAYLAAGGRFNTAHARLRPCERRHKAEGTRDIRAVSWVVGCLGVKQRGENVRTKTGGSADAIRTVINSLLSGRKRHVRLWVNPDVQRRRTVLDQMAVRLLYCHPLVPRHGRGPQAFGAVKERETKPHRITHSTLARDACVSRAQAIGARMRAMLPFNEDTPRSAQTGPEDRIT
jgi:hypothetical protein